MKEKIKAHFLKFGPRRFVGMAVLSLFITDLVNSYYFKLYWLKKDFSNFMVGHSLGRSGMKAQDFSASTLQEMTAFIDNAFYFFLLVILANNLFFYFFYLKKKPWAQSYILFYSLTAAILALSFVFDNAGLGIGWSAYNLLTIPYYLYIYFGVKLLKAETTLVSGRKGR